MNTITPQQAAYFEIIADLHSDWQPHAGQIDALRPIFDDEVDDLFLQCGRKFGKTEAVIYVLRRFALLHPNMPCYYVGPTMTHARKLIWTDPRLTKWIHHNKYSGNDMINNTEMIIRYKNGSFIQILGSENSYAANGLRPGIIVYDEFAEFDDKFHDVMSPNRAVFNCPLIVVGTPPARGSKNRKQYIALAQECKTQPRSLWIKRTSLDNPHINRHFLQKTKDAYYRRGEGYLWELYYEANIVNGGKNVVFPMINEEKHVISHSIIMDYVKSQTRQLDWYITAVPGTTQPTGVLFVALNKYTRHVYILDEYYEAKQDQNRTQFVVPRLVQQAKDLNPSLSFEDDWNKNHHDDSAWFAAEVSDKYDYSFLPSIIGKKDDKISIIKDLLTTGTIHISSRCKVLFDQICAYITKDDGTLIKGEDQLINALKHTLAAAHYTVLEAVEVEKQLGPRLLKFTEDESWDDRDDTW